MRIKIEVTAVLGERRVLLGNLPLRVDLGQGNVTLTQDGPLLTRRETQVIALMRLGKVHKEIAAELNISERTVKHHACKLYGKYEVRGRAELLRKAGEAKP